MAQQEIARKEDRYTDIVPFGASEKDIIRLSIDIVKTMVAVKTKSGKTCSDIDAMKFIAMCKAKRLNPFEGDAYLIGYDAKDAPAFSLITAHQAFLKRAELNPEYNGMKSGIIVEREEKVIDLEGDFYMPGDQVLGGWATVFFKGRQYPMSKRVRLERFKKPFGIWLDDAAGMICKCAEADALRSSFPTLLGGLYLKEELDRAGEDPKTVTPIFTTPSQPEPVVTVEEPKAPEPATVAPEPPKPAKTASRPKNEPTEHPLAKQIKDAGLTEKDITGFLHTMGVTDEDVGTIAKLEAEMPEACEMLTKQFADIVERIKSAS